MSHTPAQCRGPPELQNLENHLDDEATTWHNKFCDWRPRWTRRTPKRRAPALVSRKGAAGDGSAILTKSTCSKLYRAHALAEYHPSAKTIHGQRPNYTFLVPAMTDKWSDRPLSGNSAFNWGTGEPKPSFLDLISGVPQRPA